MASRPVWSGQLRLSLVAIPVDLHTATSSKSRISFRQIHGPTGKPVKYEKTVAGKGAVKAEDILKGYETDEGDYVLIPPEEVERIRLETKKTLELVQFVDSSEISPLYFDRPYYLVPSDALAQDAYRVVRDALRQTAKIGLGQLTMRGKEYLCAVKPCGDGLLLETLFYPDELNKADPLFSGIADKKVDEDLLNVATTLIERKTAPFKPEAFEDHYAKALKDLVEAKVHNRKTPRVPKDEAGGGHGPARENVIDLMDALKKSLSAAGGKAAAKKPARSKAG
ncbi:MAG: Ku protein [Cereibacter sphaeroides]|uniref:Non-homologous end joining protein Ku n=1 Tax=Cereibacter sphaeroides TaxID=1063 RepID=A0A2W5SJ70_CERSP|nr:MAG: Ku protein [Cereibacter sphaeroides]